MACLSIKISNFIISVCDFVVTVKLVVFSGFHFNFYTDYSRDVWVHGEQYEVLCSRIKDNELIKTSTL